MLQWHHCHPGLALLPGCKGWRVMGCRGGLGSFQKIQQLRLIVTADMQTSVNWTQAFLLWRYLATTKQDTLWQPYLKTQKIHDKKKSSSHMAQPLHRPCYHMHESCLWFIVSSIHEPSFAIFDFSSSMHLASSSKSSWMKDWGTMASQTCSWQGIGQWKHVVFRG